MVISYLGGECFKITQGDLTLAFNPPSKDSSLKTSKFGADIALVSMDHEDFNGVKNAAFGEREPFVISGPGE
ncbi:MAG TPA: MBL fold metallo-hydrolase, partial [Candidatus Paceibacterota bacterium]